MITSSIHGGDGGESAEIPFSLLNRWIHDLVWERKEVLDDGGAGNNKSVFSLSLLLTLLNFPEGEVFPVVASSSMSVLLYDGDPKIVVNILIFEKDQKMKKKLSCVCEFVFPFPYARGAKKR